MSVRPLCAASHPVLHRAASPVDRFTKELRQLARDLIDTMYAHDGIGLAAPQVGLGLRVFVANPSQERGRELVVVNPQLELLEGRAAVVEGCLSLPRVWERLRRVAHDRRRGQDVSGKPLYVRADGLLAVIFQHECDHLQGRLFIDRLPWFRRLRALTKACACA
jgi:peptide deformylase